MVAGRRLGALVIVGDFSREWPTIQAHMPPAGRRVAESFIGRLRDECLNENWLMNPKDAGEIIEDRRWDYNEVRSPADCAALRARGYTEDVAGF